MSFAFLCRLAMPVDDNNEDAFLFLSTFQSFICISMTLSIFSQRAQSFLALAFVLALGFSNACRPITEPTDSAEEVLPNVVTLTLTSPQGNSTATWRSATDVNGTATRVDTLVLVAGRTYTGKITAVNDTKNPVIDLTEVYKQEGDEHQFFYTVTGAAQNRVTFTITDRDKNNLPLGLEFTVAVSAGGAASGTLKVELGHYDDVKKDGTRRSSETDININFPIAIR